MDVPDTPYSQQAADQMQQSVSQFGPEMEKFFFGMMQNGGAQNIDSLMKNIQRRGQQNQQDIRAQVLSSQPRGGTAEARALGSELSDAALNRNIQMANLQREMERQAMQRQFQGAQGLSQMPQFYGQPSSIEQAMFSMQTPYRMQNIQNEMEQRLANLQAQQGAQQAQSQLMGQIGTYQPERLQQPSGFQQFVVPFIRAGTQLGSAALMGGG